MLDEPHYSSDEDDLKEHFIVPDNVYLQNNQSGNITSFLYEPETDGELRRQRTRHQSGSDRVNGGAERTDEKRGSANYAKERRNERKIGMMLSPGNEREKSEKVTETGDKMPRRLSRTRNQRGKQEDGEKDQKEEKNSKYEIVNFGLV